MSRTSEYKLLIYSEYENKLIEKINLPVYSICFPLAEYRLRKEFKIM